ncbi:MAG: SpoIIE family protein phosphatase [Gallionella sp.]|jgi:serine phosphatase RsbU (regulator of sigma subunit)|nr:SpoIIE family protein phosphatase [Gallionella sp.]MCK9352911.1 SpoIIE family protein phosphatase [Gallionella sp.]
MNILMVENETGAMAAMLEQLSDTVSNVSLSMAEDAVVQAREKRPDLVIIDAAGLPKNAGYKACRKLKLEDQTGRIPVLLLLAVGDHAAWTELLESGADDFMLPPFDGEALQAKLGLLQRQQAHHHHLLRSHTHIEQEIRLSRHMFEVITKRQREQVEYLEFWSLAAGRFSGDLFIYERTPEGRLHAFVADFTGHGLSAAVGALPASDAFFAMSRKGLSLREIVTEINRKLYELLPTGMFCAATLLSINKDHSAVEIWNGGVPAVLLFDREGGLKNRAVSGSLPLGILPPEELFAQTTVHDLSGIGSIVVCSDGLIEAHNAQAEMYGEARLIDAVGQSSGSGALLNGIRSDVLEFLDGIEPHDDISLVVIEMQEGGGHG